VKLLALPLYPEHHPSSRFRVYSYLPFLRQAGIEVEVIPAVSLESYRAYYNSPRFFDRLRYHGHEIRNRLEASRRAKAFDVLWVQKAFSLIYWRWWPRWFRKAGVPIVYDIDDAVFLEPPARSPVYLRWFEQRDQIERIVQDADVVLAGNRFLAGYVEEQGGRPVMLPTGVDVEQFYPKPESQREKIVIGWSGSRGTHRCLNSIRSLWCSLAERFPGRLEILVVSGERAGIDFEAFSPLPVCFECWSPEREADLIQEMDVGLMPLEDNAFQRYKCGFKAIQYMACGLPVISSPVGVSSEIVEHERTGYCAATIEEWLEGLTKLIESRDLRVAFGAAGREKVERLYSLTVCAPKLIEVFRELSR